MITPVTTLPDTIPVTLAGPVFVPIEPYPVPVLFTTLSIIFTLSESIMCITKSSLSASTVKPSTTTLSAVISIVPDIVVSSSPLRDTSFIPLYIVKFSAYVPGPTKIVSPSVATLIAFWIDPSSSTNKSPIITVVDAVLPPSTEVTVIVAFPAATAVTLPFASTVATASSLDVQVTFLFVAFPGDTVAVIFALVFVPKSKYSVVLSTLIARKTGFYEH